MEPVLAAYGQRQVHPQMSGQLIRAPCEHFEQGTLLTGTLAVVS